MNIEKRVIQKISECVAALGGKSDILGTINSWKDSLTDQEVIEGLDSWLEDQTKTFSAEKELHPA